MKLLLTSSGLTNKSITKALFELVGKEPKDTKVSFIPTAMNLSLTPDKGWFVKDLYNIKQTGVKWLDIVDISAMPKEIWLPRLEAADVLFFSGGVTLHLMKVLKDSGLKDLLPDLLKTRVYAGISAGSMIVTPSVQLTSEDHKIFYKEKFGYSDESGLGYVDFYIRPHFGSPGKKENSTEFLEEMVKKISPIYALDDQSAIKIDAGNMEVITEGKYQKFENK